MTMNPHRRRLFAHLNGLVFAPLAHALHQRGVTAWLLSRPESSLDELQVRFGANAGYLNVALRCVASMGYLDYALGSTGAVRLRTNARSAGAFPLFADYGPAVRFQSLVAGQDSFSAPALDALRAAFAKPQQHELHWHIEGALVGPLLVHMGMAGAFADLDHGVDISCLGEPSTGALAQDLLTQLGWVMSGERPMPTEAGRFFLARSAAYGVPVSYLPMLTRADELMFGDADALARSSAEEDEHHVDRRMNVWGSGSTHGRYFAALEQAVIDVFNRPIEAQPVGILDMGCGDGALLARLHRVLERTRRGRMLATHPLWLFGVDYNAAALQATRERLAWAHVPATLVWGDVGRPDDLASMLQQQFGVDLGDLLNVRTFLDHNRPWAPPHEAAAIHEPVSTGAFAHHGARLQGADVEASLVEHLANWAPYVRRHGLLVVELHTLDPALAAAHIGATLAPAYDATHGFSDQYILELEVFLRAAAAVGLYPDEAVRRCFPDSPLATVSVNLLLERRRRQRQDVAS